MRARSRTFPTAPRAWRRRQPRTERNGQVKLPFLGTDLVLGRQFHHLAADHHVKAFPIQPAPASLPGDSS